ncbi:MAG: HAD family hydrolase [Candidatus Marsarchaeota archaeon]|nr:HAD family hydrolase [Candidatus Marsarchaeota archaeon]
MQLYIAVFDFEGMLVDPQPAADYISKEAARLFSENGLKITRKDFEKELEKAINSTDSAAADARSYHAKLFSRLHIPISLLGSYERICEKSYSHYSMVEQNERIALQKVKRLGFYMAVLTNTMHSHSDIEAILRQTGLDGIFDMVFVPSETGYAKPDIGAYRAVLDYYKAEPENAVFIASQKYEIDGAKLAGMLTVSYGTKFKSSDYAVQNFQELMELLRSIKRQHQ